MKISAAHAFLRNIDAYNINPMEERYRRQLPLSLMSLVSTTRDVRVDDSAADKVHEIGMSADGSSPGALIARGLYLMDTDRNPDEVDGLASTLRRQSAHQRQVQNFLRVYEEWNRCGRKRCLPQ